jgi:hypothetical protein
MARTRARSKSHNGAPAPAAPAPVPETAAAVRAATLDQVLEQVRKIAAAERELRAAQGALQVLRDGLRGLVDRLSVEDREIFRSILSVEPPRTEATCEPNLSADPAVEESWR